MSVDIKNKALLSRYQNIMASSDIPDPTVRAMLHAMFMSGAQVVMQTISKSPEAEVPDVVGGIVDELNAWGDAMALEIVQHQAQTATKQ